MPRRFFLLVLSILFLSSFDQPKLVKTKIADGITVAVPRDWRPMDELDFRERHFSVRKPLAAFTDSDRLLSFTVSTSATQWREDDIELARSFFKAGVANMFDRITFIDEGIHEVNGKKFIYFEFESRIDGSREEMSLRDPVLKYSYVQYLVESGRTLVFSFHAPLRLRQTWQPIAQTMMKSVRVK